MRPFRPFRPDRWTHRTFWRGTVVLRWDAEARQGDFPNRTRARTSGHAEGFEASSAESGLPFIRADREQAAQERSSAS